MTDPTDLEDFPLDAFYDVLEDRGRPIVTAAEVARIIGCSHATAEDALKTLEEDGRIERLDVTTDPRVWFPTDWKDTTDRERVIVFPDRREIIVDHPSQFTRALLAGFARLADTNRENGYRYEIRPEDIWQTPHETLDDLLRSMRRVLGARSPSLIEWVESQWDRAHKFRLVTHPDGYTVLEATSPDLLGNIAEQHLEPGQIRARVSDTDAWIAADATASVKRTLYDAGYPVQDDRDLETGDPLPFTLNLELRAYQQTWVDRFAESGAGVLVGPPGSGKTIAAFGIMASIGGETLILVPSRELAGQWRTELLAHTTLQEDQVGEYHGGEKSVRPVTIATYQTAGMDRHRSVFDDRKWGLIVYDEVHHLPSPVSRRTAELQAKHRLALSSTPIREDEREEDIFTLIGPPIGTNWEALFDAGFVAEPEVEIRYVAWGADEDRNAYVSASGHDRREIAATNPAKIPEITTILTEHSEQQALIFVEYLAQGKAIADALQLPFVSGETPHDQRQQLFQEFRAGTIDALVVSRVGDEGIDLPQAEIAISASGLGGSRRQGAQRAGRTMRPVGNAQMYVLATRGTIEEDFARRRMRHLAAKGVRVSEAQPVE